MKKRCIELGDQISVRLPPDLLESMRRDAQKIGITVSTLIRLRLTGREVVTTARKAG